jgi:surfactin synthase thioesterase subunit
MQELHVTLKTPKYILELLIDEKITELNEKELLKEVRSIFGRIESTFFPNPNFVNIFLPTLL